MSVITMPVHESAPQEDPVTALLHAWGVPRRYLSASWDAWDWTPVTDIRLRSRLEELREWRGVSRWCVLLHGVVTLQRTDEEPLVGSGKTHLAAATIRRWAERVVDVRTRNDEALREATNDAPVTYLLEPAPGMFTTAGDLLESCRPGRDEGGDMLSRAADAGLLVLDELGATKTTEWVLDRLMVILNHRYNEQLPTVVTSNLSRQGIAVGICARLASRMSEESLVIPMQLPDYRRRNGG